MTAAHRCTTVGPAATEDLGRALGAALRSGDLVALDGDLGAGKTVLVRGLAEGLGGDPLAVRSPTFVLHHVYPGPVTLHHIDCYRLGEGADLSGLDLDDLLADGAVVVEWASLAGRGMPAPAAHLRLDVIDERTRAVELGQGAPQRFVDAFTSVLAR